MSFFMRQANNPLHENDYQLQMVIICIRSIL